MTEAAVTDVFLNAFVETASVGYVTDVFLNVFGSEPVPEIPTAPQDVQGKRLGCGEPRFFIAERGGARRLAELKDAAYSWGRRLDDVSTARVVIGVDTKAECASVLAEIEDWETELIIYRDDSEVWVGPIIEPEWGVESAGLPARDLFAWFDHRFIHADYDFEDEDLASVAATLAVDALSVDPSPNITFAPSNTGITGVRQYRAALYPNAGDAIRELSRTAFDFTAIGRTIRTGGIEVPAEPLVTLTNDTLDVEVVRSQGLDRASRVVLIGAQDQLDQPIIGDADLGVPSFGVLESQFQEPSILDADSAQAGAHTHLDLLRDGPVEIIGTLTQEAAVTIDELIPGARVDVRLRVGYKIIERVCRLHEVNVSGDSTVQEKIGIKLVSLGSVP